MKTLKRLGIIGSIFLGGVLVWHGFFSYIDFFIGGLPSIKDLLNYHPPGVTQIIATADKKPTVIAEFFIQRRYVKPIQSIPEIVIKSFLAAEDDHFFEHKGISFASILRAALVNFKAGQIIQGGSTITQQVAKAFLLSPEKSFERKIKEVILAFRIEENLTKQEILFLYLNQIYLGHGAYGVAAAAKVYFQKELSQLDLAETALLAGLPQAPTKYDPHLNPKRSKERQLYVLKRLLEKKWITEAQMQQAVEKKIRIYSEKNINHLYCPYYVEHLRQFLLEKYGKKSLYEDALSIYVNIQPEVNLQAHNSLLAGLKQIDKRNGYQGPIQRLYTNKEKKDFIDQQEEKIIRDKLGFKILQPNGQLDTQSALQEALVKTSWDLLSNQNVLEAVVVEVEEKKTFLMVGSTKVTLPLEHMLWAKRLTPSLKGPKSANQILHVGDVVLINIIDKENKIVALDQTPQVQGAIVSFDILTSEVIALVGGTNFKKSEFNRVTQAYRQMGSAFKPIIYSAALENNFTPATVIVDSPVVFKDGAGNVWKPGNFEEKFYGDTLFRQALIKSRNIPTIKIAQAIGIDKLIAFANRIGLNSHLTADLAVSLGSSSITLLDLAKTYAIFPRLGRKIHLKFFSKILSRTEDVLEMQPPDQYLPLDSVFNLASNTNSIPHEDQVLDARIAYIMTHLMNEVVNYGTGFQARQLNQVTAGKTGTTNDAIDGWFIGYTPRVLTAVWVGYDAQKSLGPKESGATTALPIWLDFMQKTNAYLPHAENFIIPEGIVFSYIDSRTGKPSKPNRPFAIREAFIQGTEPTMESSSKALKQDIISDFFKLDKD